MHYDRLDDKQKVYYLKRNFSIIVSELFNNPERLKNYVNTKQISEKEANQMASSILKLNANDCICCKLFDRNKLNLHPIDKEFEPLIDIVINIVKQKVF